MTTLSRRTLLTAAPALGLAGLPVAASTPEDPHPALLVAWRESRVAWDRACEVYGDEAPEEKAAWKEYTRLEQLIYSTPAKSVGGAMAQIEWLLEDIDEADLCVEYVLALESCKKLLEEMHP
ncbi:hypothetical protein [Thioclava sp. GXIMD4215]|uniref:hypothetical protein n=1 Tax=Thioclava sp. GXIMD4215 TaxID=3131928 RepID=UPI0032510AA0